MTAQQMVALCARLFAVWLFVASIRTTFAMVGPEAQSGLAYLALLVGAVAPVLTGLLLWNFPMVVASKLIPRTNGTNLIALRPRELAAIGSALLGLWTIIVSMPIAYDVLQDVQLGGILGGILVNTRLVLGAAHLGAGLFLLARPWVLADMLFPARAIDPDLPESPNPLP